MTYANELRYDIRFSLWDRLRLLFGVPVHVEVKVGDDHFLWTSASAARTSVRVPP